MNNFLYLNVNKPEKDLLKNTFPNEYYTFRSSYLLLMIENTNTFPEIEILDL